MARSDRAQRVPDRGGYRPPKTPPAEPPPGAGLTALRRALKDVGWPRRITGHQLKRLYGKLATVGLAYDPKAKAIVDSRGLAVAPAFARGRGTAASSGAPADAWGRGPTGVGYRSAGEPIDPNTMPRGRHRVDGKHGDTPVSGTATSWTPEGAVLEDGTRVAHHEITAVASGPKSRFSHADMGLDHQVSFEHDGKAHVGAVKQWGHLGATLSVAPDQSFTVPYRHMTKVAPPPPTPRKPPAQRRLWR